VGDVSPGKIEECIKRMPSSC